MKNDEEIALDTHVCLSPADVKHARTLFRVIDEQRDYLSHYMAWPALIVSPADMIHFLAGSRLAHLKDKAKTYLILVDADPQGILSFNHIDHGNKTAYFGYWLSPEAQGKGIITRGVTSMIQHYAAAGMIQRFVIKCVTTNAASNGVAQRCGFQLEGVLRRAELLNGVFHDQNIYAYIAD